MYASEIEHLLRHCRVRSFTMSIELEPIVIMPGRPPEPMSFTVNGGSAELALEMGLDPVVPDVVCVNPVVISPATQRAVLQVTAIVDNQPAPRPSVMIKRDDPDDERDIYRELAADVLRKEQSEVTPPERRSAKRAFWAAFRRVSCLPGNEVLRSAWETTEMRAQAGYEKYLRHCKGLSVHGEKLPGWWAMDKEVRDHWAAAFSNGPADEPPQEPVVVVSREDLTTLAVHAEGSLDPRSALAGRVRQLLS